jgi:hypothetical protein
MTTQSADDLTRTATGALPFSPRGYSPITAVSGESEQRCTSVTATLLTIGSDVPELSFADVMRSIESSGIEIDALWLARGPQGNQVHLVLQRSDESDARLAEAALHIDTSQDVVLVEFEDHPGAAAEIIRRLTSAGVRVSSAQLATSTRMVIISDDPNGVTKALD